MDYQEARRIRKKSLVSLITEQKFGEGKSLTSSVGGAISQKFKAKSKGMKEAFDPLNWVRKLTGKGDFGDFAVSGMGRLFGRSDKDIRAFGGVGRKKHRGLKDPNFTTISAGPIKPLKRGDPSADILAKMYNFMQLMEKDRELKFEIDKTFKLEQIDEDNRRHKALIDAILKYRNGGRPGQKAEEKKESAKTWVDDAIDVVKSVLPSVLSPILGAAAGVGGGILAGGLAASYLATGILATEGASSLREGSNSTPMAGALAGDTAMASAILDPGLYDRQKEQESKDKKLKALAKEFDKEKDITKVKQEVLEAKKQLLVDYGYEGSRYRVKKGKGDKEDISKAKVLDEIDAELIKRKSGTKELKTTKSETPVPAKPSNSTKGTPGSTDVPVTAIPAPKETPTPTAVPVTKQTQSEEKVPVFKANEVNKDLTGQIDKNTTVNTVPQTNVPAPVPVQTSANLPIPEQVSIENNNTDNQAPIVSVSNNINNVRGKDPKIVQTTTAKVRNVDMNRHLQKISVSV